MTRTLRSIISVGVVLAATSTAHAQRPAPVAGQKPATPFKEPQARALTEEGLALFRGGRYDEAIARFQTAYTLVPLPGLLFNIAQAYRLKGAHSCTEALAYYQRFLRKADAGDPSRPVAEKHVRALVPCPRPAPGPPVVEPPATSPGAATPAPPAAGPVATPGAPPAAPAPGVAPPAPAPWAAPPASVPLLPPPPPHPGRTPKIVGLVSAGTGLVLLTVGLYYNRSAAGAQSDLQDRFTQPKVWTEADRTLERDGERAEVVGNVLVPVGAAALIGGGALYYFGWRRARAATREVALVPTRGGLVAAGSWAF
jgi:tetratricopeptide (TPR) repeat protein